MKFKNLLVTSVIALTASCWAETSKAFTLIDNFNAPNQEVIDTNSNNTTPTSDSVTGSSSDILGTVRDIRSLSVTSTSGGATFTRATASTGVFSTPANVLQFQKNGGSSAVSFRVDYDGTLGFASPGSGVVDGTTTNGLGNLNFESDPNNVGIVFDIIGTNDLGVGSFATLTAFTTSGTVSGVSTLSNIESLTAIDNLVFLFSTFGGVVNFTQVGALRLDLTINPLSDGSSGFRPAAISFEQVEIAQVPFEFSPVLGVSVLAGLYGLNRIRKSKIKVAK